MTDTYWIICPKCGKRQKTKLPKHMNSKKQCVFCGQRYVPEQYLN